MIIDFAPWHVEMMSLAHARAAEVAAYLGALERLGKAGCVRTIVAEREGGVEVLGVAGVTPCADGAGEVFVLMGENRSHKDFVKGVRQLLDLIRGHFATIRALGEENDARIERWLSRLGFEQIGSEFSLAHPGKRMIVWRLA